MVCICVFSYAYIPIYVIYVNLILVYGIQPLLLKIARLYHQIQFPIDSEVYSPLLYPEYVW